MSLTEMCRRPRLCELGKIKIGRKSQKTRRTKSGAEWRAPEKLDHFVITTMQRDGNDDFLPDKDLMSDLLARQSNSQQKLTQIPVMLLSDDPEECLQAAYVWYSGRRVGGRSDGKTVTFFRNPKTGAELKEPQVKEWKDEYLDLVDNRGIRLFKTHATLNVVVSSQMARWGGVYKFRTTSQISLDQLYSSLIHIATLTGGVLTGLPMQLVLRPVEVSPNGKSSTVYVVHLELVGNDLLEIQDRAVKVKQHQLQNAQELRSLRSQYKRLIHNPGEGEDELEQAAIAEEFAPGPDNAFTAPSVPKEETQAPTKPAEGKVVEEPSQVAEQEESLGVSVQDQIKAFLAEIKDSKDLNDLQEIGKQVRTCPDEVQEAVRPAWKEAYAVHKEKVNG